MANRLGETIIFDVTVMDPVGATVDLNDFDMWYTLKDDLTKADSLKILQKTKGSGIEVNGSDTSKAVITLTTADTKVLTPGLEYRWDFVLKDTAAPMAVTKQMQGTITFDQPVTIDT